MAQITAWNPLTGGGQMRIIVVDENAGVATAEVVAAFTLHEAAERPAAALQRVPAVPGETRPGVVVTGAAGGLGSAIVRGLADTYTVLAIVHRQALDPSLAGVPHVHPIQASLSTDRWEETVGAARRQRAVRRRPRGLARRAARWTAASAGREHPAAT